MAKLIDADKRIQEIKKIYCTGCDNYGGAKCRACWVDDAMCLIDDAPTVDAVPVVRCRDCKYRVLDWQIKSYYCCHPNGLCGEMDGTRYCDCGERKDGDGNG